MLTFRSFLNEDVTPHALSDGKVDIEDSSVRDEINALLSNATSSPSVTPYNTLQKVRKVLAYFHIHLPKRSFMEGGKGVEVWTVSQFGDRMGMTDQGEWIKSVPGKFYLFFQYQLVGSHFHVRAKIVDKTELDKEISAAEVTMKESSDAETQQSHAKAKAPKEDIKSFNDGSKKAVKVSDKKHIDESSAEKLGRYLVNNRKNQNKNWNDSARKGEPNPKKIYDRVKLDRQLDNRTKGKALAIKKLEGNTADLPRARVFAKEETNSERRFQDSINDAKYGPNVTVNGVNRGRAGDPNNSAENRAAIESARDATRKALGKSNGPGSEVQRYKGDW